MTEPAPIIDPDDDAQMLVKGSDMIWVTESGAGTIDISLSAELLACNIVVELKGKMVGRRGIIDTRHLYAMDADDAAALIALVIAAGRNALGDGFQAHMDRMAKRYLA